MVKQLTPASLLLALLLPAAALAQMGTELDTDGDGAVTMSEFTTAMPDVDAATFATIDADADGVLSADEIADAVEAGVLPQG